MIKTNRRVDYAVKVTGFCVAYGLTPQTWCALSTQLDETSARIRAYEANPTPVRRTRMQSEVIRLNRLVSQHGFTIDWTQSDCVQSDCVQSDGVHDGTFTLRCNGFTIPFPKY